MVTVEKVNGVIRTGTSKAGNSYTIVGVVAGGKAAETFDANVVVGDTGELKYDEEFKVWKFEKPRNSRGTSAKIFKADPAKMKQEFTLEVAKNLSIQRQVALKGAIDLIVAGKRSYGDLVVTFDDLMSLLNPKQVKDHLPTDAEVDNFENDLPPIETLQPPIE